MIRPQHFAIALILVLIAAVAALSKLRFVDPQDHAPQRWTVDEHPAFRQGG